MLIHTYIHTYTHIYIYIHKFIHTYTHTYIHTYIHTYTHTHIHTYIIHACTYRHRQSQVGGNVMTLTLKSPWQVLPSLLFVIVVVK